MDIATTTVNLSVSRFIQAPRERVFAAWLNPDDLEKWIGPETCRILSVQIDPRVGGEFRLRVRSDNMGELEITGVYREIQAPNRLVFTWGCAGATMEECQETLVSVDFIPVGDDGTDVQIFHEDLPSPSVRDDHSEGWTGSLVKLCKLLAPGECSGPEMPVGSFCWNELLTRDVGTATRFYSQLFDWQALDSPLGDIQYKLFKQRTSMVGGAMTPASDQVSPQWLSYVRVDDVDATAQKAGSLGGKLIFNPTDIPTVGRIAIIQDPQGAVLGLFAPGKTE